MKKNEIMATYQVAARIQFGIGASLTVGTEMEKLGFKHAFIVTDEGAMKAGLLSGIQESLSKAGMAGTIFDQVRVDPNTGIVNKCADEFMASGCDCMIAVGGGSVLDCAKAAGLVVANGGRIEDYLLKGGKTAKKTIPPLFTIPTTAGTGSEVSTAVVVTLEENHSKIALLTTMLNPTVAILDPELTRSLPPGLTASSGLDALCHGIERFTSTSASPLNDCLALQCIKMVADNLRQAYANPNNLKAREGMMWAALLGGMSRASVSAAHVISGVVGGYVSIPHGIACSLLTPPTMEFNLISNPQKFALIAKAMGERLEGLSIMDAAERSVEAMKRLMTDVGVTQKFRDFGMREEQIPEIANTCLTLRGPALKTQNPRIMAAADVEAVLKQCY